MKNLLVLNFFPAFTPPSSGGELRYFHMYNYLSRYYDITLLSPTYNDVDVEIVDHSDTFREYRIPKEDIHNSIHWQLEQENFATEFSALTCAYSGQYFNQYHKYYLKLYQDADIIIHESPFMLRYDIFFGIDKKPRIYNSYNVEYELLKQIYKAEQAKLHLQYIYELEKELVSKADLVFAISKDEREKFYKYYGRDKDDIKLAPNGIIPQEWDITRKEIKSSTAFFIGSGHIPNIETVNFIVNELADKCKDIEFVIAGSCCNGIETDKPNVKMLGLVSEDEKYELFATSDIAINPMFSGAGTNLKTLEYMAMGIPMVSTSIGVRGIDIEDDKHFILADKDTFAQKIKSTISNDTLKNKVATNSKDYVNEQFSWHSIVKSVKYELDSLQYQVDKTVLLLNDFEVSSPFGGGEIRINKLYSELSKTYKVLLLCLNDQDHIKYTWITDRFCQVSIPKTKQHKKEEQKYNAQSTISINDIVSSFMITQNETYMDIVQVYNNNCDVVILSHPYLYEAIENLKCRYLIHESLNVEYKLKEELFSNHPSKEFLLEQVKHIESGACCKSDLIISVSDQDHKGLKEYLKDKNTPIITVKNGVEIVTDDLYQEPFIETKNKFKGYPIVTFIGSAHLPNIDSAKYIVESLSIALPEVIFVLIGTVCDAIKHLEIPRNVLLFGKLDVEYKNILLSISNVAINPMFGGSGSNLKLAEYFAWRLPTVTTSFGARGYDIVSDKEAVICDIQDFSYQIKRVLQDSDFASLLGNNAFSYVEEYVDWRVLGKEFRYILDQEVFHKVKKRLLIVTHRFTTPPLGGAEVYLYQLVQALDKTDKFDITIAFIDSFDIENEYHFSIKATHNTLALKHSFKNVSFKRCRYEELSDIEKQVNSKKLMSMYIEEFLYVAKEFESLYDTTLLLGGWNFYEKSGNIIQIWSSQVSQLYCHTNGILKIKGFSPSKKRVSIKLYDTTLLEKSIKGNFTLKIEITQPGIVSIETLSEYIGDDIRPLGVLVDEILLDDVLLKLDYCYRDFLKKYHLNQYIDKMIDVAKKRDNDIDEVFHNTRGFSSKALESYLDKYIETFDTVLGHSTPFKHITTVEQYALKYKVPYTLLPHFHFDDEFYHWKSYYQAMQNANIVFASPTISIDMFFDKLSINTIDVPGGGISLDEYKNIDTVEFEKIYNDNMPFFLILGRKSGSKNYKTIINAFAELNKDIHRCNLVMIGRDEDKEPINSSFVYYLDEQPREVVLGALSSCYGLINMSDSESFGIVILEAWMLKKPVIVNEECPAFRELVTDNENGILVSADELDLATESLLLDKKLVIRLGQNGHNKAIQYDWSKIGSLFAKSLYQL